MTDSLLLLAAGRRVSGASVSMTFALILKALLVGVINAAPIGPVGLMCLRKNSVDDRWRGLCAALGMALAYGIIAFCVLFGLKKMMAVLEDYRVPLQLVGGVALIFLGWRGWRSKPKAEIPKRCASRYLGEFTATFAMTLFNPVPFATFAVILATFKIVGGHLDLFSDVHFAFWVFAGTLGFWVVVNQGLHAVRKHSTADWCRWISHGSAIAMVAFGVVILVALFFTWK